MFTLRRDGFGAIRVFVLGFRRSDHAFFFGGCFLLLQLHFLGIFRVLFAFVYFALVFFGVVIAVIAVVRMIVMHAGIGSRVRRCKHTVLRIARGVVILSVGDML